MGDASGAFVAALAHLTEASFPFPKIWSLYPAILGQAIPSAFGRFRLAVTLYLELVLIITWSENKKHLSNYELINVHYGKGLLFTVVPGAGVEPARPVKVEGF